MATVLFWSKWVSVPLRGKYRGEFYRAVDKFCNKQKLFPSPCGVNIVANISEITGLNDVLDDHVSVPLRGKYRGEWRGGGKCYVFVRLVSVPLRGKYRGELSASIHCCVFRSIWFPSPCGVNIVANLGWYVSFISLSIGFRPLAG